MLKKESGEGPQVATSLSPLSPTQPSMLCCTRLDDQKCREKPHLLEKLMSKILFTSRFVYVKGKLREGGGVRNVVREQERHLIARDLGGRHR